MTSKAPPGDRERKHDEVTPALPPIRHRIVAYDYGIKENILRRLRQNGFGVTVVPATTTAEEVLALKPEGVFLSNGPGRSSGRSIMRMKRCADLMGQTPIFGICLGHQVLGLRLRRTHFQTQVRPSRRESTGERSARRAKLRSLRRIMALRSIRFAPAGSGSDAHQFERRHGRGNAAPRAADFQRAISSRGRARPA